MEKMYQYMWKYMVLGRDFSLSDGRTARILHPGRLNSDAGPDFFNARIEVDGIVWAGNIEIHIKASDWFHHGHDKDPAYDSIILHVVVINDATVSRADGSTMPTLLFVAPRDAIDLYGRLSATGASVRCGSCLGLLPGLTREDWLESLGIERLQTKAARITDYLKSLKGDWEQTCFVALARAMGFGLNGTPLEILARNLPLKYIYHHSDNPFQIEALLFGQAGFLDSSVNIFSEYYQQMCREYYFLARKYSLRPMNPTAWKFARTRPYNFPHRRIAFLAKALEGGFSLMRKMIERRDNIEALSELFKLELTGFWKNHYSFESEAPDNSGLMSPVSINILLINLAAPFFAAYGAMRGDEATAGAGQRLLESLQPEKNGIINVWSTLGLKAHNAFRSQALIHLRKEYCDAGRCLDCRFGNKLLKLSATEHIHIE